MTVEERLKDLIVRNYGSLRKFSEACEMPYGTVDTIIRRGINKANVQNIIKICNVLEISTDALADGMIVSVAELHQKNAENMIEDIKKNVDVLVVDGEPMTEDEFIVFSATLDYAVELVKRMRER